MSYSSSWVFIYYYLARVAYLRNLEVVCPLSVLFRCSAHPAGPIVDVLLVGSQFRVEGLLICWFVGLFVRRWVVGRLVRHCFLDPGGGPGWGPGGIRERSGRGPRSARNGSEVVLCPNRARELKITPATNPNSKGHTTYCSSHCQT